MKCQRIKVRFTASDKVVCVTTSKDCTGNRTTSYNRTDIYSDSDLNVVRILLIIRTNLDAFAHEC